MGLSGQSPAVVVRHAASPIVLPGWPPRRRLPARGDDPVDLPWPTDPHSGGSGRSGLGAAATLRRTEDHSLNLSRGAALPPLCLSPLASACGVGTVVLVLSPPGAATSGSTPYGDVGKGPGDRSPGEIRALAAP